MSVGEVIELVKRVPFFFELSLWRSFFKVLLSGHKMKMLKVVACSFFYEILHIGLLPINLINKVTVSDID